MWIAPKQISQINPLYVQAGDSDTSPLSDCEIGCLFLLVDTLESWSSQTIHLVPTVGWHLHDSMPGQELVAGISSEMLRLCYFPEIY